MSDYDVVIAGGGHNALACGAYLAKHGLEYIWSEDHIEGHPNTTGPGIIVYKDIDKTCDTIAEYSKKDAGRYKEICEEFIEIKDGVDGQLY